MLNMYSKISILLYSLINKIIVNIILKILYILYAIIKLMNNN